MYEPVDRIAQRVQASQDRSEARRSESPTRLSRMLGVALRLLSAMIVILVFVGLAFFIFGVDDMGLTH